MQIPSQKREYWRQHILKWQASGLSQQAYCKPLNLKHYQLSYWHNALKKQSKPKKKSISSGFATVNIRQPKTEELMLSFPSGIRLSGIEDDNLRIVKEIVEILK